MLFEEGFEMQENKASGLLVKAILVAQKYEAPVQAELLPPVQSSSFDIKC